MLINEYTVQESWSVADGIISNIKICGLESVNGYKYPAQLLQDNMSKYEGRPIYLDHKMDANGRPAKRAYSEHVGVIKPGKIDESGLWGTAILKPQHPLYESILWDIQNKSGCGFSHCIDGDLVDGVVTAIECVHSVDIVTEPATNKSFTESVQVDNNLLKEFKLLQEDFKNFKITHEQVIHELEGLRKGLATEKPVTFTPASPALEAKAFSMNDFLASVRVDGGGFRRRGGQ